jgi:hypothetical protein
LNAHSEPSSVWEQFDTHQEMHFLRSLIFIKVHPS